MRRPLFALLLSISVVTLPTAAFACGGMFCSTQPPQGQIAPAPVDQTAERIVFEVDEETITAHIQISYTGTADDFAWILPVPSGSDPIIEESTVEFIQGIDISTGLQVLLPQPETCAGAQPPVFDQSSSGGGGCGCSDNDSKSGESTNTADSSADAGADAVDPVTVYNTGFTDEYEFSVIGAMLASDLTTWLQMNAYNVSDNMVPVMQPYVDGGFLFLAVKLREGRSSTDVVPLAVTYSDSIPMIPLKLTAVAAQPLMGISVFILADEPYAPSNFNSIEPDTTEILHDAAGNTNYFDWVSRRVEEEDGRMWIREYVGTPPPAVAGIRHTTLSRYYTRLSPHRMLEDPMFINSPALANRAPFLDLSARPSMVCNDFTGALPQVTERLPSACAFNYCGSGECAVVDGQVNCLCAPRDVAQTVQGPDGQPRLTCVPAVNEFGITAAAGGAGTEFDPCAAYDCGAGTCVLKSGFPTCDCNEDAGAFIASGLARCAELPTEVTTFGAGAGLESQGATAPLNASLAPENTSNTAMGALIPLMFGVGLSLAWRRRRRGR